MQMDLGWIAFMFCIVVVIASIEGDDGTQSMIDSWRKSFAESAETAACSKE